MTFFAPWYCRCRAACRVSGRSTGVEVTWLFCTEHLVPDSQHACAPEDSTVAQSRQTMNCGAHTYVGFLLVLTFAPRYVRASCPPRRSFHRAVSAFLFFSQTSLAILAYFQDELQTGTLDDCMAVLSSSTTTHFQAMQVKHFLA